MDAQFSPDMVGLLDDVTLLNRAIYGGPNALQKRYLDDYDAGRDPDAVGNREALYVYDRYDLYLDRFGFSTLSSADLGFKAKDVGASEVSDGLDHNYTYAGGLFRNTYMTTSQGEVPFEQAGAVALVSVKHADAGNTLYLTFRGTDADGPTADGEAGTANGQMRYYEQLRGLIDQVYDYVSDPGHQITDIVVSGHSLGGAVADIFALYDGARFDAIDGVKLSVIALASAGVDPGLLDKMPGYDTSLVDIGKDGAVTLDTPDWYFQYDQADDIVRNPDRYDSARHFAEDPGQAFITGIAVSVLRNQVHFGGDRLQFETPMIDQYAVSKNLDTTFLANHYADFYELIGTEFSEAWPFAEDRHFDRFIALFGTNDRLNHVPRHNNVNGWDVSVDNSVDYRDAGARLFLLGLSGNDTIHSGRAADFIAGGADDDRLYAGTGRDILLGDIKGETGNDILFASKGADILIGGRGDDRLTGGGGADTFVFETRGGADTILDFHALGANHDLIDLSRIKGIGDWADLGTRMADSAGGVVISGTTGETILLAGVAMADLGEADFLL